MEGISKDEMKHGTTTVGIVTKEGVVVAADKRATMGYLVAHKNVDKVVEITDRILMTTAGMVGDAQMLAKYLKAELELYEIRKNKKITVKAASTLLVNILYSNRFSIDVYTITKKGISKVPKEEIQKIVSK